MDEVAAVLVGRGPLTALASDAGLRSISPLVDITNYVMLERGQPMHAFDEAKLKGAVDVRFMKPGESIKLLNDQQVEYRPKLLAITDASGPVALGGVKQPSFIPRWSRERRVSCSSRAMRPIDMSAEWIRTPRPKPSSAPRH